MDWRVTTPPAQTPVDYDTMKRTLRLADDRSQLEVMGYVAEATAHAEQLLEASLVERVITATYDEGDEIVIARGPLLNVTSLTNAQGDDVAFIRRTVGYRTTLSTTTLTSTSYPLTLVYVAGYGAPADVPADIRGLIRIHAATLFAWREDISAAPANAVYRIDEHYRSRSRGGLVR